MNTRKEYNNRCFSPNWIEIDLDEVRQQAIKEEAELGIQNLEVSPYESKEERLESQRRKDLNTLLKELDEIKQGIERAAEKQHRLANLMKFYTGEFAK